MVIGNSAGNIMFGGGGVVVRNNTHTITRDVTNYKGLVHENSLKSTWHRVLYWQETANYLGARNSFNIFGRVLSETTEENFRKIFSEKHPELEKEMNEIFEQSREMAMEYQQDFNSGHYVHWLKWKDLGVQEMKEYFMPDVLRIDALEKEKGAPLEGSDFLKDIPNALYDTTIAPIL